MNGFSIRRLTESVTGASGGGKTERIKNNCATWTGNFQRETLYFKGDTQQAQNTEVEVKGSVFLSNPMYHPGPA